MLQDWPLHLPMINLKRLMKSAFYSSEFHWRRLVSLYGFSYLRKETVVPLVLSEVTIVIMFNAGTWAENFCQIIKMLKSIVHFRTFGRYWLGGSEHGGSEHGGSETGSPQMVRSSHGKIFLRPFGTNIRNEWDFFIQILKNFEISNNILWKSDMVITIESYVIEKRNGNVSFNDRDFRRIPLYSVLFHFIRKNRTFNFFEIRKIELALKLKCLYDRGDTNHTTAHIISLNLSLSVTMSAVSGTPCLSVTIANSCYQSRWRARWIILLLLIEPPWCSDTRWAFWIECGANYTANLVAVQTFWKGFNFILSFLKVREYFRRISANDSFQAL